MAEQRLTAEQAQEMGDEALISEFERNCLNLNAAPSVGGVYEAKSAETNILRSEIYRRLKAARATV